MVTAWALRAQNELNNCNVLGMTCPEPVKQLERSLAFLNDEWVLMSKCFARFLNGDWVLMS